MCTERSTPELQMGKNWPAEAGEWNYLTIPGDVLPGSKNLPPFFIFIKNTRAVMKSWVCRQLRNLQVVNINEALHKLMNNLGVLPKESICVERLTQINEVRQSKSQHLSGLPTSKFIARWGSALACTTVSVAGEVGEPHYSVKGSETNYVRGLNLLS